MNEAQQRAMQKYRQRLHDRGLIRFEVLGRKSDIGLLREIARHLIDDEATQFRDAMMLLLEQVNDQTVITDRSDNCPDDQNI